MTQYISRDTRRNGAAEWAEEGQGNAALPVLPDVGVRQSCRDTAAPLTEHHVLAHLAQTLHAAGVSLPPARMIDAYISFKSNPFVVLTGAQGHGKTEFMDLFAASLLGDGSPQYARISGGAGWHGATGEDDYYRHLKERFDTIRFLEVLQEAADPASLGKLYIVCFDGLLPSELDFYFTRMLRITPHGEKRLILPGLADDAQPVIPANVLITATVDRNVWEALSPDVARYAGTMEFATPALTSPILAPPCIPAVGTQRLWLRHAIHNAHTAKQRLITLLGSDALARLRSSNALGKLLWRSGTVLLQRHLRDQLIYVANSFDAAGNGLFDRHDRMRNAQIAFDAQVVQRTLWQLRAADDAILRDDLHAYLSAVSGSVTHLAAA